MQNHLRQVQDGCPSCFRLMNLDLLHRAVVREAAIQAVTELHSKIGKNQLVYGASAVWLEDRITSYLPLWEAPAQTRIANMFVLELLTTSPVSVELPNGEIGLTDPELIASMVIKQQARIGMEWSKLMAEKIPQKLGLIQTQFMLER